MKILQKLFISDYWSNSPFPLHQYMDSRKNLDIQLVLKSVLKQILIYGGEFYVASFVMSFIFIFRIKKNKLPAEQFTDMLEYLFPNFLFVGIFVLKYTIYTHESYQPLYNLYPLDWSKGQKDLLVKFAFLQVL